MAKRKVVTVYKRGDRSIYYKYAGKVYGFSCIGDGIPIRAVAYKIATGGHHFFSMSRTEHFNFNKHREEYTYITRFQFILPSK